jgi:DNA-binding GntR family transcriptional regulator
MLTAVPRLVDRDDSRLPKKAGAAAIELLREAIVDGRLAPGQRLKEEEIAQELGISRTPVREALLVLQSEGLVEAPPNRGARVREFAAGDLDELYQLRALVEGYAARRAAARISAEELRTLEESCERFDALRAEDDLIDLVKENLFFHSTILEAAGSEQLRRWAREVVEIPLVYRSYFWYSPEQKLVSEHYHKQIANALASGDGERAEMIMKEHVLEARDFLLTQSVLAEARQGGGGE